MAVPLHILKNKSSSNCNLLKMQKDQNHKLHIKPQTYVQTII